MTTAQVVGAKRWSLNKGFVQIKVSVGGISSDDRIERLQFVDHIDDTCGFLVRMLFPGIKIPATGRERILLDV